MSDRLRDLVLAFAGGADGASQVDLILEAGGLDDDLVQAVSHLRQEGRRARRQREAARILVDAATLITGARDMDETLELICRRTRLLVDSDMAYVSLNDLDQGQTYIRTTDGVLTSAYRNLRMPLGTGILGQAAGGATVSQTGDYLKDPSFPHIPSVDDVVREEGVVSILAATLRVRGRRIGALLVADRRQRTYTPDEVDLLTQTAGLSAVALSRNEEMRDLQAALEDLTAAREEIESQNLLLGRLGRLDQELFSVLREEASPAELAEVIGGAIDTEVKALFPADLPAHRTANDPMVSEHPCQDSPNGMSTLVRAFAGHRELGALEAHGSLDRDQRFLFERGATALTALLLAQERGWATQMQQQHRLVKDLENSSTETWRSVAGRLAPHRLQEGGTVRVLAVRTDQLQDTRMGLRELLARRGGISSIRNEVLRVISPDLTGQELHELLVSRDRSAAVCEREALLMPEDIRVSLQGVQRTVRAMAALNITGVADPRWDLGLTGLAVAQLPPATVDRLVHRALEPLLGYDRQHGTELTHTAWSFLECDGRVSEAAERLHIHPNTLRQRVGRIGTLLGEDWHQGSRRTDLHLALRLHRVQSASRNGGAL